MHVTAEEPCFGRCGATFIRIATCLAVPVHVMHEAAYRPFASAYHPFASVRSTSAVKEAMEAHQSRCIRNLNSTFVAVLKIPVLVLTNII